MKRILVWFFILSFSGLRCARRMPRRSSKLTRSSARFRTCSTRRRRRTSASARWKKKSVDLRDKSNQPAANNYASADDLKKLAEQVQELAKKQQDDNDLILKELEGSAKAAVRLRDASHRHRYYDQCGNGRFKRRPARKVTNTDCGGRHAFGHRQGVSRAGQSK